MILDIIIILIIIFCVIMGYKKGLIEVAFRLISFLLAIILSLILYTPVSNYIIENTQIDDKIKEIIINNINPEEIAPTEEIEKQEQTQEIPEIITEYVNQTITNAADTVKENGTEILATNLSIIAVKIITLILLFIVIRLILTILKFITNIIAKLPIINSANKIRRHNIWNTRRTTNSILSTSISNGNIYNNRKSRNTKIHKRIKHRKNNV